MKSLFTIRRFASKYSPAPLLRCIALCFFCAANVVWSATFYVSPKGNNRQGNGSPERPWASIGHGIRQLKGGDTLIVKAGVYQGVDQFINTRLSPIANGRASAFTTIKAETPFEVRIKNGGSLKYQDSMVYLAPETEYVHVDGFIFDMADTYEPTLIAAIDGNHNKLTRSIFRRAGNTNEYAGWVGVSGKFNLVEDCAGVGMARYGFITGGPESTAANNIFRRCVARIDYANSPLPKAAFAVYGNNSGDNVRNMLFQNCMAIDGRRGPSAREDTYGGFYFPKNATNVTVQGSVVLNNEAGHAAYFVKEQQARNIRIEHSIAWDVRGAAHLAGIRANGGSGAAGDSLVLEHLTVGKLASAVYNRDSAPQRVLKNSLFVDVGQWSLEDKGWTVETNNAFAPARLARGRSAITGVVQPRYLPRAEAGSALSRKADDGADVGATILYRYGAAGSRWGEPGFDKLTREPLWPWPYEDQIKAVFAEKNDPPPGSVPPTNDTRRGFAAVTDAWGQPMSLTRYVWQYLGNPIPAEIYAPAVPGR